MWGNVKRTLTSNKCFLCRQVCQQGRKKKARKGRPKILPPDCPFNHTEIDIFSSLFHDTPGCVISTKKDTADLVDMLPGQVALYICRLCSQLSCGRCVKTACVPHEHYFCSSGLSEAFRNQLSAAMECPVCKESISFSDVRTSGCVFCQQLSFLKVQCNLCSQRGIIGSSQDHCCYPLKHPKLKVKCNQRHTWKVSSQGNILICPPYLHILLGTVKKTTTTRWKRQPTPWTWILLMKWRKQTSPWEIQFLNSMCVGTSSS